MTLDDLIAEYRRSHDFRSRRYKTRALYEAALRLLKPIEAMDVAKVRRRDILAIRDSCGSRAGKANIFVAVTSVVMRFGVEREYLESNPAREIKGYKLGEWKRWPDETIEKFLASPAHHMMKLAVLLAVYTGQRQSDLLSLTWAQCDGGILHFRQQKTGVPLVIPIHHRLQRALTKDYYATGEPDHILHDSKGCRWTPGSFRAAFAREMKRAGIFGFQFHGLRKSAAARLAESGCSELEISSITGHKSLQMISHYTKEASQIVRAKAAMRKLSEMT